MTHAMLDEEWSCIRSFLPSNLDAMAHSHGAMKRKRGEIKDAETLLRLILMHVGGGLSLEQTVMRAREQGLASLSGVGLFKRLKAAEKWLAALTGEIIAQLPVANMPTFGGRYNVRALDATYIQEPGSTGTDWRIHYSLKLPELVCDFFEITDVHGGESLKRLPVKKGDLVLADRAYSKRPGLAGLLDTGAHVLVRLLPSNLPLLDAAGRRIDLPKLLSKKLPEANTVLDLAVCFEYNKKRYPMRLCAIRKSETAIEAARRRAEYESERKGSVIREETLEYAAYVIVLNSLPTNEIGCKETLELYRCRWQVELAFKRLKSLLAVGHLPKKDPRSCRAWMQAKVLIALLTDRLVIESELFSPWGYILR